jgi:hypothetical protein
VKGRKRYFWIDPEDAILPTLKGSGNLSQLKAAWEFMRKHLGLGRDFFQKYLKEFRNPDFIEDYSPTSTTKEWTNELKEMNTEDSRLRFMMAYYPHHNEKL